MATDKELIIAVIEALETGLSARSITGVTVQQANQPTQQGAPSGPVIFTQIVGSRRFGFLKRESKWLKPPEVSEPIMQHIERQYMETRFQIDALAIQDPTDLVGPTASDLLDRAASIMQSDATRAYLRTKGIGILRVTEERNPYFMDDKERFEASPSFDFILTHERTEISLDPSVETYDFQLKRV